MPNKNEKSEFKEKRKSLASRVSPAGKRVRDQLKLEENAKMNSITKKVWNQNYIKESEKSANDSQSM